MSHSVRLRIILIGAGLAFGPLLAAGIILAAIDRFSAAPVTASTILLVLLIVAAASAAAAAAVGLWSVRRILQPIETLTEAADAIGAGDLTPRAPVTSDDEFGVLAGTFNHMARRLRDRIGTLEQRVSLRSKALAAVRDISRLSAAPDENRFAAEVAERVKNAFNYYHVQIYRPAETGGLILAAATGEAGRKLLAAGHGLARGEGPAGRAAESNTPVLAADLSLEPGGANPLPKSKSEAAVPIAAEGRVLGVLDVHQVLVNGVTRDDVDLLQAIAAQTAAALLAARRPADRAPSESDAAIDAIARRIGETTTAAEAARVAESELARALPAREVHVVLQPPPPSSPDRRSSADGEGGRRG